MVFWWPHRGRIKARIFVGSGHSTAQNHPVKFKDPLKPDLLQQLPGHSMMSLVDTWWTLHMAPHGNHGTVRMSGSNTVPGSSCKSHVQSCRSTSKSVQRESQLGLEFIWIEPAQVCWTGRHPAPRTKHRVSASVRETFLFSRESSRAGHVQLSADLASASGA